MAKRLVAAASLLAAGAVAVGAGCGGSDEAETTDQPGEIVFDLDSEQGATGVRARLTYVDNERTRIVVDGLDEGEPAGGGPNAVRLVSGTCAEPGQTMESLEPLSGSESSTEVGFGLSDLMAGSFAIQVALPEPNADEVVACADVPDEAP